MYIISKKFYDPILYLAIVIFKTDIKKFFFFRIGLQCQNIVLGFCYYIALCTPSYNTIYNEHHLFMNRLWQFACESYAEQLIDEGDIITGASYLINILKASIFF